MTKTPLKIRTLITLTAGLLFLGLSCVTQQPPSPENTTQPNPSSENTIAQTVEDLVIVAPDEPIKTAFVYAGPVGAVGWSLEHEKGRLFVDEKYPWLSTIYVESVPESYEAIEYIERLIRLEDPDIIVGTSFGYQDPMLFLADAYPSILFLQCDGLNPKGNFMTYSTDLYQMFYLNGMMAAALSETGRLGFVAPFPIPEIFNNINAFTLGARAVDPEVEVEVEWTYAWYGPDQAMEAARSLISQGADGLAYIEDTQAVIEVTEQEAQEGRKVHVFGHASPMLDYGPATLVSGQSYHWGKVYEDILLYSLQENWEAAHYWGLASNGAALLVADEAYPINPIYIPALQAAAYGETSVYDAVLELYGKMQEGREPFDPFKGPILDNQGKLQIQEGELPTWETLESMDYFVEGVLDSPPL
jgi:basic membrane protein A